tara:strand:+ start:149 stop:427 length:279 start_codon:yes stop_codon:yes gene_type:complete
MLFVRADNFKHITNVHTFKVKTGTSGHTANKGSVAIRFNFHDTSFMFMNCHLTSGQKKVDRRLADIRQTLGESRGFFEGAQSYGNETSEYQH